MSQISSIRRAGLVPVFLAMVVLCATLALKLVGSSDAAVSSTMRGFVHEDNSIGLTFDDGTAVGNQDRTPPTIPPGAYTIRMTDDANEHNFHLSGPGVDMATGVDTTSSPTWTVTLQPGATYKFQCDTHFDFMYGVFQTSGTAGSASSGGSASGSSSTSTSSSSSSSSAASSLAGTLAGTLSASGSATLTSKRKAVSRLKAGRYSFAITDKDSKGGFTLQGLEKAPKALTGVTFVGRHTIAVTLTAGTWTFYASGGKTKRAFTVVA
jgi:hypothetical protein